MCLEALSTARTTTHSARDDYRCLSALSRRKMIRCVYQSLFTGPTGLFTRSL
ncbi:hypothetical protein DPMN_180764 [Dreissena polymorpha]|uniref:Uncharacterized protein n=1 Tax=Dreissena polymorpha TaxID=45954 RepID=A0A9D4DB21_DREPO|nr:hypothetical protein DPMN_180764 [Dreissena polymorpha]